MPQINPEPMCQGCGGPIGEGRSDKKFCSRSCGRDHSNLRQMRGRVLYDMFMGLRFERGDAEDEQLWSAICRQAALWREEDIAERNGAFSWGDWRETLAERPYLKAKQGRV